MIGFFPANLSMDLCKLASVQYLEYKFALYSPPEILTSRFSYPFAFPAIGNFLFALAPLGNALIARPHPWNSPDQPLFAAHQYIYSPPFGYALPPPVSAVGHPIVYSHLLAFRLDGSLEQARY